MDEAILAEVRETIADMKDLIAGGNIILGQKFAWGQIYGGKPMDLLKGVAKKKLSEIRPVAHFLTMRVTQNVLLDKWPHSRTIITMEETTIIKQGGGGLKTQGKGSLVDLDKAADPPRIAAPNGKEFVDIVMVQWA